MGFRPLKTDSEFIIPVRIIFWQRPTFLFIFYLFYFLQVEYSIVTQMRRPGIASASILYVWIITIIIIILFCIVFSFFICFSSFFCFFFIRLNREGEGREKQAEGNQESTSRFSEFSEQIHSVGRQSSPRHDCWEILDICEFEPRPLAW